MSATVGWIASQYLDDGRWGVISDDPADGEIIVGLASRLTEERARLIAAAPDLLEALESAVRIIDDLNSAYGADSVQAVSDAGRAAIAKATGITS